MQHALAFFALLTLLTAPLSACASDPDRRISQMIDPTVQVFLGSKPAGTGTVIACEDGKTLVITAHHVIERAIADPALSILIRFDFGSDTMTLKGAVVVAHTKEKDAALLLVNHTTTKIAKVYEGEKPLPPFTKAYAVSTSPFNLPLCFHGEILGHKDSVYFVDAHMHFGSSGGGLYAKVGDDWVLIGILQGVASAGPFPLFHAGVVGDLRGALLAMKAKAEKKKEPPKKED